MDGQNYVVFHNDSNDSYMNSSANFRGADVGTTFIDMYFQGAQAANDTVSGYDKVRLTVTATYEEAALEGVAAALAGAKNPVTVVADDKNSVYVHDRITAVASITLASQTQTRGFEAITTTKALEASDSGKIFTVDQGSAYAITLPLASDAGGGWYADFYLVGAASNAVTIISDGAEDTLIGTLGDGGGGAAGSTAASAVDSITWVSGDANNGDWVRIVCSGSLFYVHGIHSDTGNVTID